MKTLLTRAAWVALAVASGSAPSLAQLQDNSEKQMTCSNGGYDSDGVRHCEIREQSVPSTGQLTVDSTPNGAATVKGWLRGDVLVRTRVETRAESQGAAAAMASQVSIDSSGGQVRALGPTSTNNFGNNFGWSVSYEIFVPQNTDLNVKTHNGAITISDVRGQIRFEVSNGAVRLKRVAGDVSGSTSNGAIQADLAGAMWDGRQMELSTHNGAVTLSMPQYYSAHIKAETSNGGIHSDFPLMVSGELKPRNLDFNLGSGGPLIHVTTSNGQVNLKRSDAQ
jgi:DUF4097 and DUF4098 domain-containing protein YvlB